MIAEIDSNVRELSGNRDLKYRAHIGGGHYASVTTGFRCVDLRKWYVPYGQTEIRPSKTGIALRLGEWEKLRTQLVDSINSEHPVIGTALPCFMSTDHSNQEAALECRECYPFLHN
jgi:hypothetical protein